MLQIFFSLKGTLITVQLTIVSSYNYVNLVQVYLRVIQPRHASLTRLPVLIEAVGRAVSNETETINRNMDTIMMKLAALEVKFGDFRAQNGQRE